MLTNAHAKNRELIVVFIDFVFISIVFLSLFWPSLIAHHEKSFLAVHFLSLQIAPKKFQEILPPSA